MFANFDYMDVLAFLREQYAEDLKPTPERPYGRRLQIVPMSYDIDFDAVSARVVTRVQSITANADFLWLDTIFFCQGGANTFTLASILVQNAATGEKYMQASMRAALWASVSGPTSGLSFNQAPAPVWLPGKSSLVWTLDGSGIDDAEVNAVASGVQVRLLG